MNQDQGYPHYKLIKTNVRAELYLNWEVPWNQIILIAQLRINANQISKKDKIVRLNKLNNLYYKEKTPNCLVSNSGQEDTLFHMICICQNYNYARYISFPEQNVPTSENDYYQFVNRIQPSTIKSLKTFFRNVFRIRDFVNQIRGDEEN